MLLFMATGRPTQIPRLICTRNSDQDDQKTRRRRNVTAMGQFCDQVQIAISDIFFTFLDRSVNRQVIAHTLNFSRLKIDVRSRARERIAYFTDIFEFSTNDLAIEAE